MERVTCHRQARMSAEYWVQGSVLHSEGAGKMVHGLSFKDLNV